MQPASWWHLAGWTTSLPLATESLQMLRTMDTQPSPPRSRPTCPAALPGEPITSGGVLYGINPASNGIV